MERFKREESELSDFNKILRNSWDESTCWPKCWNPENPANGHCRVTAVLVQHYFGGEILFAQIGSITHYWNLLPDGQEKDFTRDQFPEGTTIPEGTIKSRDEVLEGPTIQKGYQILFERISKVLLIR